MSVAQDVRIGGDAGAIVAHHALDHFSFIFVGEVDFPKGYPERRAHAHRVEPILPPRAFRKFRLPYLDEYPDDIMPLLLQECSRDRTVHSPRQSDEYLLRHEGTISKGEQKSLNPRIAARVHCWNWQELSLFAMARVLQRSNAISFRLFFCRPFFRATALDERVVTGIAADHRVEHDESAV